MTAAVQLGMKTKKLRRQIKKAGKTVRKALKGANSPAGLATGALTLGGLAAVVAFDPEIRQRSRAFAGAARDFFMRAGRQAKEQLKGEAPRLETTH